MKNTMTCLAIAIAASLLTITGYHLYLTKKGVFDPHLKGVYTVDVVGALQEIRKEVMEAVAEGRVVDVDEKLAVLAKQIETLAEKLPEGYILLPDDVVLGGKRKVIDLKHGTIKETKLPGKRLQVGEKEEKKETPRTK